MPDPSEYWDALAPHHDSIENNYLDLPSLRRIVGSIRQPVLVVGAGQGLIVEELRGNGFRADGVDWSAEMIRYARTRRGLALVRADARALPFAAGSYETILYATGVVDFMGDEGQVRAVMNEARRIAGQSGAIFVAFYRLSAATKDFLAKLGLLRDGVLYLRDTLEMHRLNPVQMFAWAAKKADASYARAVVLSLRAWARSTRQERGVASSMRKIFRQTDSASRLIHSAPERQPYRNEAEIRALFERLIIPVKKLEATASCYIVEV